MAPALRYVPSIRQSHLRSVARCSIVLIHAHEEPLIYGEIAVYVPRPKMAELQRQHSEDMLVAAKAKVKDTGIPYTVEVLVGPIAQTIAEHAEHIGCDAIVMGDMATARSVTS